MSGNGRTRLQAVTEDLTAVAMDIDETIGMLIELADKDTLLDMKDDPYVEKADRLTKALVQLDLKPDHKSLAMRTRQTVLTIKELDWGHTAGQSIKEVLYPCQVKVRKLMERVRAIRGALDQTKTRRTTEDTEAGEDGILVDTEESLQIA